VTAPRLEFDEVRVSFAGGAEAAARAEHISRLAFEYLHEMLASWEGDAELSSLRVPPVSVRLDASSDEEAARETATSIYRALLRAL
jgi:hypothetical protein